MRALLTALFALQASLAHAVLYDGNAMHNLCIKSEDMAMGYVAGWLDKLALDQSLGQVIQSSREQAGQERLPDRIINAYTGSICIPEKAQLGQIVDLVCKHIEERPETRHKSMNVLLLTSLKSAFPCQK